jgi:hypothetical protein
VQPFGAATAEGSTVDTMSDGHRRTTVAIVYGKTGDPLLVICDPETDPPGQQWFTIVLDDSEGPDGPCEAPVCVDCLLGLHPRLGAGLLVALEHRGAEWRDREWVPAPELWVDDGDEEEDVE